MSHVSCETRKTRKRMRTEEREHGSSKTWKSAKIPQRFDNSKNNFDRFQSLFIERGVSLQSVFKCRCKVFILGEEYHGGSAGTTETF